jgi:hypothetical protein
MSDACKHWNKNRDESSLELRSDGDAWCLLCGAVYVPQAKLGTLEIERSMDQKLIDAEQGRIRILVAERDEALRSLDSCHKLLHVIDTVLSGPPVGPRRMAALQRSIKAELQDSRTAGRFIGNVCGHPGGEPRVDPNWLLNQLAPGEPLSISKLQDDEPE